VTDQLLQLVRNVKIPKSQPWLLSVAKFLAVHALFVIDEVPTDLKDAVKAPMPALSQSVRDHCRSKFFSVLAELNNLVLPSDDGILDFLM
jgi:hypothetical protein